MRTGVKDSYPETGGVPIRSWLSWPGKAEPHPPGSTGRTLRRVLQSARVGLSRRNRPGRQHSRLNDKQGGSACQKCDDDPRYYSRTFARRFFGMMELT